ncbi:MAG: hypothetical protein A2X69_00615 [Rhodobacteraceae bacterium GWF1_65_7]|nr:MAG: hypothetical protein A2X69_00615 [Rhodobacteraceae bacterium GWF1_65_7]
MICGQRVRGHEYRVPLAVYGDRAARAQAPHGDGAERSGDCGAGRPAHTEGGSMSTRQSSRIHELCERLKEARKTRKHGKPGENPKRLRNAIRAHRERAEASQCPS